MRVEPHPHIGLQTVTWPFVGEVRHRDTSAAMSWCAAAR